METFAIILVLAVAGLAAVYLFYNKSQKEKKGKDPSTYIEGLKALLEGRDEHAFSKFREVVAEDSSNIDAYVRIGNILRKYDKSDKALQVHKDLTLRQGLERAQKISILTALADDYIALEDYYSAESALKELRLVDPSGRGAVRKLLEVYSRLGNWDEAFVTKELLIKMGGDKTRTGLAIYKYFQGQKLFDEKKFHKARILFKEAIGFDTKCTPAYILIGDSYLSENRTEDAVNIWRRMLVAVPDEAHLALGRIKKALFELGRYGEISDICREVIGAAPTSLDARLALADYYSKKGEYSVAIEHLRTAADNHPESYLPTLELAKLYLMSDDKERLKQLLDRLDGRYGSLDYQYRCKECGHLAKEKMWLCPKCYAVDSFAR